MSWKHRIGYFMLVCGMGLTRQSFSAPQTPMLRAPGPIRLNGSVELRLRPPRNATQSLPDKLKALKLDEKVYLVLRGLRINQQPGIVYQIYLGSQREVNAKSARLVGTFNFFNVPEGKAGTATGPQFTRSFDVTQFLKDRVPSPNELAITIMPSGTPAADSNATIEVIEIVVDK